jgi:hypothetical protein
VNLFLVSVGHPASDLAAAAHHTPLRFTSKTLVKSFTNLVQALALTDLSRNQLKCAPGDCLRFIHGNPHPRHVVVSVLGTMTLIDYSNCTLELKEGDGMILIQPNRQPSTQNDGSQVVEQLILALTELLVEIPKAASDKWDALARKVSHLRLTSPGYLCAFIMTEMQLNELSF